MKTLFFRHKADIPSEPHVEQLQSGWPDESILLDGRAAIWRNGEVVASPSQSLSSLSEFQLRLLLHSSLHERIIKRYAPDIIVAHTTMDGLRIARSADRLKIPLAIVCHGSDVLASPDQMKQISFSGRQLASRWPRLIDRTTVFVAVSEHLKSALDAKVGSVGGQQVVRHYLGTDSWRRYSPDSQRSRDLLFVGRLRPNKGPQIFVDVINHLAMAGLLVTATIIGDGSMREHLSSYVSDLGLSDQIRLVGALPQQKVFEAMGQHRLIIVPSVQIGGGISEGLGLASIEAQGVGTPALVSAVGGLPETVLPGVTGEIALDARHLAECALSLLSDTTRWKRYSEAAHEHVKASFNRDVQTRRLFELLRPYSMNRAS